MTPGLKDLTNLVGRPVGAASKLLNKPIGVAGNYRPMRLLDSVRGDTLEKAVRGRVILITGASSGIGHATALKVGAAGGTVVLVARGIEKLEETRADIEAAGGAAFAYPCDLTNYDAIDGMAARVLEHHDHVDILVNNAGRSIRRSIELSYDRFHDFERTMQLNYFAPVRLILRLLPTMREQRWGHIINISSVGVPTRTPRFSGYIASKAALDTWSDAVQAEVHDHGVRFTTIHMPLVRTPMISPTKLYDRFPTLTPDEAAGVIGDAIVHRPRRIGPAFGHIAAFADALTPQLMDAVRNRGFRMFPDSSAARGAEAGPPPDERVTAAGAAFARATRGVHW